MCSYLKKTQKSDLSQAELCVREYESSDGIEYFISFESKDKKLLYGFLRLRINYDNSDIFFPELKDSSLVRELHVYGQLIQHNDNENHSVQHFGFGKKLIKYAEYITKSHNLNKMSIISGIGVRKYYEKQGYHNINTFMIKNI